MAQGVRFARTTPRSGSPRSLRRATPLKSLRVVVLYEDKTRGGLNKVVAAAVAERRVQKRKSPLDLRPRYCGGNTRLLEECRRFGPIRYSPPYRADHVFAVIDGKEIEGAIPGLPAPPARLDPGARFEAAVRRLASAARERMSRLALERVATKDRAREAKRFHPHVLFWERESVLLAGAGSLAESLGVRLPDLSAAQILRDLIGDRHAPVAYPSIS